MALTLGGSDAEPSTMLTAEGQLALRRLRKVPITAIAAHR